jgi:hypothetical protein
MHNGRKSTISALGKFGAREGIIPYLYKQGFRVRPLPRDPQMASHDVKKARACQIALSVKQRLYQKNREDSPMLMEEFTNHYALPPDRPMHGVNIYYGVLKPEEATPPVPGTALQVHHQKQLDDVLANLLAKPELSLATVNIVIEPLDKNDPYGVLTQQLEQIKQLARDLNGYQTRAFEESGGEKRLQIVIRYASEMNGINLDPTSQPWGRSPGIDVKKQQENFRKTYVQVWEQFRVLAPDILFAFSPILHRGVERDFDLIAGYWPGDDQVDVLSCTWYARYNDPGEHDDEDRTAVSEVARLFRKYLELFSGKKKPIGIDEIGGTRGEGPRARDNDCVLMELLAALPPFTAEQPLLYVTFFQDADWAKDARLSFLVDP